jgi:dTDP-4-dehydrorhamnose 3,5-epimerase
MNIIQTPIDGLIVIEPRVFEDERGYFFETFNAKSFPQEIIHLPFVQDNESKSSRNTMRGLHYQLPPFAQSKLVRVIYGEVIDVAVDIRIDSPTYGKWYSAILSGDNKRQMYVPRGFAHGYAVLSDEAVFAYKCDNYYSKAHEGGIRCDDPVLNIDWQVELTDAIMSQKDQLLPPFGAHIPFE